MGYIKLFNNTVDYEDYINGDPLLPNVSLVEEDDIVYYNPEKEISFENEYLYLEALEDGMTVSFDKQASSGSLYYSLDKQEWNEFTEAQTINNGEKVYFKGDLVPSTNNGIGTFTFDINKQCNVAGNAMSLIFADSFVGKTDLTGYDYAFYYLFKNCTYIQSAENLILPATTLASSCYNSMFLNCINLTTAPKLPATTLTSSCYCYMFQNCTSLTTAPELHATELANNCYSGMFSGCIGLTSTPELPATILVDNCYKYMFYSCTNLNYIKMLATDISASSCLSAWVYNVSLTGTFVKAEGVEIPTGTSGIPNGWTVQTA